MVETEPKLIPEIPEDSGKLEFVLNRHAEPAVYEQTGAALSERGQRQASESGLRLYCLVRFGTFPILHDQEKMPRAGFLNAHELIQPLQYGLAHATPRISEIVPQDTDTELTEKQAIALYNMGVRTVVLPYGSDRKRCMDTWEITKQALMSMTDAFLAPDEAASIHIQPYSRDPRLSSANTLDAITHIGIKEKAKLVPAWLLLDGSEALAKVFREKLAGRTPTDVADDISKFVEEKTMRYRKLLSMGMNVIINNTTHETQLEACLKYPTPIGFSTAYYFRLLDLAKEKQSLDIYTARTPYLNEQAKQQETR